MAVVVNCHMHLRPAANLMEEIDAMIAATLKEEGCVSYVFMRDQHNETHYMMVEEWASQAALDAHLKTAHFARLNAFLTDISTAPAEIRVLRAAN